ncbi:MAG: ABC transporter ATP-binding protein [Bacteroidetes bacterium]|nr:ABC transporter ATP-binding protein [Bacteroidota bacterium]
MDLFIAKNVTKTFAQHKALDRVDINVPEGSIFGLLGPNGAGKTTFIRIVNRILAPDEGELYFRGNPMTPSDIFSIGYLPEERGLYKKMKIGEQALYLTQLKGLSRHDALTKLKYWFEKFEITSWWNRKVEELSKGMQQKVQFIVTIIHEPTMLIFDEPFSGFDPINVNLLKEEILQLQKKGSTIIFSTHNMASVEELCDNIALINNARKILEGNVWEIKKTYKTNTFEVQFSKFDGDLRTFLPSSFECLELNPVNEHLKARIRIPAEATPNDLIRQVIPHVMIHSVNEIIPSMNDIFIRTVTSQHPDPSTSSSEKI